MRFCGQNFNGFDKGVTPTDDMAIILSGLPDPQPCRTSDSTQVDKPLFPGRDRGG